MNWFSSLTTTLLTKFRQLNMTELISAEEKLQLQPPTPPPHDNRSLKHPMSAVPGAPIFSATKLSR